MKVIKNPVQVGMIPGSGGSFVFPNRFLGAYPVPYLSTYPGRLTPPTRLARTLLICWIHTMSGVLLTGLAGLLCANFLQCRLNSIF